MTIETIFLFRYFILIAIFLPLRQADLAASASLQGIRSEGPRLMSLRGAKRRGNLIVLRIHMRLPRSLAVARNDAASSARE
jgi:hypothetical protein